MTTVRDLDDPKYTLIQTDFDVKDTLESIGLKKQKWTYLFIELDKSGADYARVYGSDSCYLDAPAYLIYTNRFNQQ